jgi:hypothetical protein
MERKLRDTRNFTGIFGISLLIVGVLSLVFQYSITVNNIAYAQVTGSGTSTPAVDLGPYIRIGPPFRSTSLDTDSNAQTVFVGYAADTGVHGALLDGAPGERAQELQDPPQLLIEGGTDPAIDVGGDRMFVTATRGGPGDIANVVCPPNNDDGCSQPQSVSTAPQTPEIETSCFDRTDNDGDGLIDEADPDCAGCFPDDVEPTAGVNSATLQFITAETAEGGGGPVCPVEEGDECVDDTDNDGDVAIDEEDPDCSIERSDFFLSCDDGIDNDGDGAIDFEDEDCGSADLEAAPEEDAAAPEGDSDNNTTDTTDTTDAEPTSFNPQTITTTPQLTFVQSGGGGTSASNSDIAVSSDGDDAYTVWEQGGDIMFRAGHGCADGTCAYGPILNLSNNPGTSREPRVATSSNGEFVQVAWQDNTPGNDEIFVSTSADFGDTFNGGTPGSPVGNPRNVSNTRGASNDLQLVTEGAHVYIVFVDFTVRQGAILFTKSDDNGESFGGTINLSANIRSFSSARDPDMAAQGELVSVVWTAYHGSATNNGEIVFRESTDFGDSFNPFILVSNTEGRDSREPQVDYTPEDSERYVVWEDQGGPRVAGMPARTYNVLAVESDNGITFSPIVNLFGPPNGPTGDDLRKDASQLQSTADVAIWDPSGRRG